MTLRIARNAVGVCLCSVLVLACKSEPTSSKPTESEAPKDVKPSPTQKEKPPTSTPTATADGPVEVKRTHDSSQRYTLKFERKDARLTTSWLATAEVLSSTPDRSELGIDVLSISSERLGKPPKKDSVNVKVRVAIEDGSHDATIVSSDSTVAAAGDLTAFEMIAGDFCQPPSKPLAVDVEHKDGERTHSIARAKAGASMVQYTWSHRSEEMDADCTATIDLSDGYAGKREHKQALKFDKGTPPAVMTSTLEIRRL